MKILVIRAFIFSFIFLVSIETWAEMVTSPNQITNMPSESERRYICDSRLKVRPHELWSCMEMLREAVEKKQLKESGELLEFLTARNGIDDKFDKVLTFLKIPLPISSTNKDAVELRVYEHWDAVIKDGFAKKCNEYGVLAKDDLKGFESCLIKLQILRNRMASSPSKP